MKTISKMSGKKKSVTKHLFITIFFGLFINSSYGFQNSCDSLKFLLEKSEKDKKESARLAKLLGDCYLWNNTDSSILYFEIAYEKAISLKDKKMIPDALQGIGNYYMITGNYDTALVIYSNCKKLFEEANNKLGIAQSYLNLAGTNWYKGIYDEALKYYQECLKIAENIGDLYLISDASMGMGTVHYSLSNFDKAIEYYRQALKPMKKVGDILGMANNYMGIGMVFRDIKNSKEAESNFKISLDLFTQINNLTGISQVQTNWAILCEDQGKLDKAIELYYCSIEICKQQNDKEGLATNLLDISGVNIDLAKNCKKGSADFNKYCKAAIENGLQSLNISKETGSWLRIYETAENLKSAYNLQEKYKEAFEYAHLVLIARDTLYREEKTKALADAESKFHAEKKQLEIDKLNQKRELDAITIEAHEERSRKQQVLILSFVAGFIIILVFSFFLYRMFIQKKKANYKLAEQNEEIRQKNEEITSQRDEIEAQRDLVTHQKDHIEEIHKDLTDSINYAERIQRSFMATETILNENLNDFFVLFRPKDVVSGDFYWAGKLKNNSFALVTADSTGHGVPGAIMSILNISSIEKAVENGLCEPSEIFNLTRKNIIERLKNDVSTEGGKDGMDASILIFEKDKDFLKYSAANNPIWVIRNNELIELLPDKMPLGKHDKDNESFNQSVFEFQSGDLIYTMSDGYEDQFGGPKGKKFLSKNLKQLLLDNSQKPLNEQKEILEKTLIDWIGNGEQIDDITIFGIKI